MDISSTQHDLIGQLLRKEYRDPDGGPALDVQVRSVVIANSLDGREVELVDGLGLGLGRQLAVVSDPDTHQAMGRRVERALGSAFRIQSLVLDRLPHADQSTLDALSARLAPDTDALIAVGSGTINDICKMTAATLGRPYAVFGTAPSMNGYASVSASICIDGFKRTLPARAPAGVFLDLSVLARAPLRLIQGGLGECLCRPTAQSDWLLAHMLLDQPYREAPFALLAGEEDQLFAHSDALVAGDLEIMGRMARTLVLSGFGMVICGGSYPASQGEHLISHYMDMLREDGEPMAFHGEQIGVSSLFMAALQHRFLAMDTPPRVRPGQVSKEQIYAHFGPVRGEHCWHEFAKKRITAGKADDINQRLAANWDGFRARLHALSIPLDEMRAILERAGAPTEPHQLGWPAQRFRDACNHAHEIRDRFTFLDLAALSGVSLTP